MKTQRSIVVMGQIDPRSLAVVREAAAAVGAPLLAQPADTMPLLEGASPLMFVMPMHTGVAFETCAQVRNDPRFANTPIVAISESRDSLAFTELFHSGGDDIVVAGDAASFARRVRAVCGRNVPRASTMPGADSHAVIAGPSSKWQTMVARAFSNAGVPTKFVATVEEAISASAGAKAVIASEDLGPNGAAQAVAEARLAGSNTPWVIVAAPKQMATVAAAVSATERVAVIDGFAPPENALFVANDLACASYADNRAATRLLYGTSVSFRVAGRDEADDVGVTYNVSMNGLFIRTLAPLEAGDEVWLELCAPRSSRRVRLVGKVAWRRHFGPNESATVPAGFGAQIIEGLASDLERWHEGCAQLERDEARVRTKPSVRRPSFVPSLLARATI